MCDINVWLVDKYFLPAPFPSKNRYKIFLDIENIRLVVFSSVFSEYGNKRVYYSKKSYKNAKWVYVPSINLSVPIFYISFAFFFIIKGLFLLVKEKKRPDVIIASCPDPFQALAALFLSKIARVPFIVDFRDYWPELLSDVEILQDKSVIYRFIFLLTKILAKHAKGIMAAEDSYIRKYLESRSVQSEKPIFIRENIFIDNDNTDNYELFIDQQNQEIISQITMDIEELKSKRDYVILMVGRQNIKDNDVEIIRKSLEKITLRAGIVILSNDAKVQKLFDVDNRFVKVYRILDRKSYLKIIEKIDAMLLFVTDTTTKFSSNKMFDALSKGKPVIIGVSNLTQTGSFLPRILGTLVFNVTNPKAIEYVFKELSKIIDNERMRKNMSNFCIELYECQKKGLLDFIKNVVRSINKKQTNNS